MSIRKLLAESRRSGDATVYDMEADGVTIKAVRTRPARGPFKAGRLTREEAVFLLTQTGVYPETLAAEAYCGMQPNDWDLASETDKRDDSFALRNALKGSGILSGYADGESGDDA